jgi:hypothetical protein
MKCVNINYVIDEVLDMLLMNKSVLFVSDMFEYDEIIAMLKENFEEISLYGLTFLKTNSIIEVKNIETSFDNVIVYLKSEEDKVQARTILGANCFVF